VFISLSLRCFLPKSLLLGWCLNIMLTIVELIFVGDQGTYS
jgi:hypothetical protein